MNLSERAQPQTPAIVEAVELLERAIAILDAEGETLAAIYVSHALAQFDSGGGLAPSSESQP